jgi:hypothetical protein
MDERDQFLASPVWCISLIVYGCFNGLGRLTVKAISDFLDRLHVAIFGSLDASFRDLQKAPLALVIITKGDKPQSFCPRLVLSLIRTGTALNAGHFENP